MTASSKQLLNHVQNLIEHIYHLGAGQRACDYLINRCELNRFLTPTSKVPKELFLVRKSAEDTVEVALFLDRKLLTNLRENDPLDHLDTSNLNDFLILIEGISHFVYYLCKARRNLPITQLEMELQAEIDKFLMPAIYHRIGANPQAVDKLFSMLFEDFHLHPYLPEERRSRYLTASRLASQYCHQLKNRFDLSTEMTLLIDEIRHFYHLPQEQKIRHIVN